MTCRKRRYPTRVDAMIALADIDRRAAQGNENRDEIRAYRCPRCKGWHVTSQPKGSDND